MVQRPKLCLVQRPKQQRKMRGSETKARRGGVTRDENELRLKMLDEEVKIFD